MNLAGLNPRHGPIPTLPRGRRTAFTITEVMVSMAIVTLVMAAILSCHLFGMRMFELTKSKLGASDDARTTISFMIGEIRAAKTIRIGQGDQNNFASVALNTPQIGSAVQIHASTNTNTWIRYFWDGADNKLKRAGSTSNVSVVANSVSNAMVFTAEDHTGKILTNNENNRVIGLTLQFYQLQYPLVSIGPGNHYDHYQLRTKITRRTLE